MSDHLQKESSAKMMVRERVQGYSGYEQKAHRSTTDQRLREHLVSGITRIAGELQAFSDRLKEGDAAKQVGAIAKIEKKLRTVTDSLGAPAYEAHEFFDLEKIDREKLDRLYEYDHALVEKLQDLTDEVAALQGNGLSAYTRSSQGLPGSAHIGQGFPTDTAEDPLTPLRDLIDGFNQDLFEREILIAGETEQF